jgi:prepilin-type N-terminal cleavage/methylation domain-containing protein
VRRAFSLVEIIVTVALIALLAGAFFVGPQFLGGQNQNARPDGKGETIVGRVKYRAKDQVCKNNLSQLRSAIEVATDPVEETRPSSLAETRLGSSFMNCPVGGEAYEYDPATGAVSCKHEGHEKY